MPKDQIKVELESRIRRALISYSVFRMESAVVIGLTLILAVLYPSPFPWWNWYYWVAIGLVAEALIIYTSMTDLDTGRQVMEKIFREEHNPRIIRSPNYRKQFERALEYQSRLDKAVSEMKKGPLRDRLQRVDRDVQEWVAHIYHLAQRIDRYEGNEIIARDLKAVPAELKTLEARWKLENDERVQADLLRAIEQKQTQWANLQGLQNAMESAQVRLESTLTALGTVYSQTLLVAARGDQGATAERISADIADQTLALQDVIETMDDVLGY